MGPVPILVDERIPPASQALRVVLGTWAIFFATGRLFMQIFTSRHVTEQLFLRGPGGVWYMPLIAVMLYGATFYFIGRLCIALPASAMRPDRGLRWAWDISRGRVGPILGLNLLPFILLGWSRALAARIDSMIGDAILTLAFAASLVALNVILAVAYGRLERHQRQLAEEMSIFEGTVWERM